MAVDAINNYGASAFAESLTSKNNESMSMDDFFSLMVAQLKNQDMFNSVDDSQFVTQMAQFSMVQAMQDMSELTSVTYGLSLMGKEATVAYIRQDGSMGTKTGIIESVNLFNGGTEVMIGGEAFNLSNIMSVGEAGASQSNNNNALVDKLGLIGREVTVAYTDEDDNPVTKTGTVSGIRLVDDEVLIEVDGKNYTLNQITAIQEPNSTTQEP